MSRVRILFLGTPDFAVASLKGLLADEHFEVVGVVSQPDRPAGRKLQLKPSPVKELALSAGLPVWTPATVNKEEFRSVMRGLGAESAVVVAFGQILGQKFMDLFPFGCVNVHGSLLLRWRGAAPIQRALMAGDAESGVSLQVMVRELDAGPVLGERRVQVPDSMDAAELYDQLKDLGSDLLHVEYMDYLRGNLTPKPQDGSLVTLAPKLEKAESPLQWARSARELHNHVRGLTLGPVASFRRADAQMVKVWRTEVVREAGAGIAGAVTAVSPECFEVQCGQGVLRFHEVQPESRARQAASAYLRGYPMSKGEVLK